MKTKSIFRAVFVTLLLACTSPVISMATDIPVEHRQEQLRRLEQRLDEIKNMDRKSMTLEEKREVRKELKTIKKEMKAISGGVYISVGALILIALLLILLA